MKSIKACNFNICVLKRKKSHLGCRDLLLLPILSRGLTNVFCLGPVSVEFSCKLRTSSCPVLVVFSQTYQGASSTRMQEPESIRNIECQFFFG